MPIRNLYCVCLLVLGGHNKDFYFMWNKVLVEGVPSKQHWLYGRYNNMKTRCRNKNTWQYAYYGGMGIEFRFKTFTEFFEHVSNLPGFTSVHKDKLTLDRIDNDSHYEQGNLRWISTSEQGWNTRIAKNNKSGVKGVYFDKNEGLWRAQINAHGKRMFVKSSKSKDVCIRARKEAEKRFWN